MLVHCLRHHRHGAPCAELPVHTVATVVPRVKSIPKVRGGRQPYGGSTAAAQGAVGKGANMKVPAYYSINPSDPDVYHDYDDCKEGKQIPPHNKRQGTNGYRRCLTCIDKD